MDEPGLTRGDVLMLIKNTILFPFPQICKHMVAADLLSMLEARGEPSTKSLQQLAKTISWAKDDEVLEILENSFQLEDENETV